MNYLRWEQSTTLRAWEYAGMAYDSTLSYADRPYFRCGTCFESPAFDPVAQEALSLRVRPLIAMECTVMAPRYMGLGNGDAASVSPAVNASVSKGSAKTSPCSSSPTASPP